MRHKNYIGYIFMVSSHFSFMFFMCSIKITMLFIFSKTYIDNKDHYSNKKIQNNNRSKIVSKNKYNRILIYTITY